MTAETGKLILAVDDDEGVREFLTFLLKKLGHRVETATDGEEAARKAVASRPDMIVLDLMLPRYGGFELLHRLQQDMPHVPIVVVTGRYTDAATSDLIRQEPNVIDLIEKPHMDKRLPPAVERGLALGRRDGAGAPEA